MRTLDKHLYGPALAALAVLCFVHADAALASRVDPGLAVLTRHASTPGPGALAPAARGVWAVQTPDTDARASSAGNRSSTRSATAAAREQPRTGRGASPVHTAGPNGPGHPGYVHYYLLRLPDQTLETLVGIEMPGHRIAWSFPDIGVTVVPLVAEGVVRVDGREFEYRHLYGIRPFPDEAAMNVLRRELPDRVGRWVAAGTPYCENDGPYSHCMSCLGFALRVLFPGRQSDFPELPRDFIRAASGGRLSTETLLLYLTGMLDLPNRDARVRRINDLALRDPLREDVLELVQEMGTTGTVQPAAADAAKKRQAARAARSGTRPAQRKPL